jgi:hypothetical protein
MDVLKMIAELRSERDQVEEAILSLERLALGRGKRRGRPPKWITDATDSGSSPRTGRKKRVLSAEARARIAAGQRKRWAAVRQAQA